MSDAKIGYGTEFWLTSVGSPGTLTEIAEVFSVSTPNPTTDTVEATHYKSPGRTREYITGLIDPGEMTVEMNYVPGSATDTLIQAVQAAGVTRAAKIVVPNATTGRQFTFDVVITGYEKNIPVDDRMTATLSLRITGAVTEAAVSA